MKYITGSLGKCLNVVLDYGEDIQDVVDALIQREQIRTGIICAGLGGFSSYGLILPEMEKSDGLKMCWENTLLQLAALTGSIDNGMADIHSVISIDSRTPETFAGKNLPVTKRKFYCQLMLWEIV